MFKLSNDTEMKEKEYASEDVYDKDLLDQLLQNEDIDAFREEFLSMHKKSGSRKYKVDWPILMGKNISSFSLCRGDTGIN